MLRASKSAKAKSFTGSGLLQGLGIRPLLGGLCRRPFLALPLLVCCSFGEHSPEPPLAAKAKKPTVNSPHPRQATAWDTQVLVASFPQPPLEEIQSCQSQLVVAAKEANQEADIITAMEHFIANIRKRPLVYHWCFYNSMYTLDNTLLQRGLNLNERSALFFETMKELWILARALDSYYHDNRYFPYLQRRYIDTSQQIFGRDLSIVGHSLDAMQPSQFKGEKPLGEGPAD